MDNDGDLDLAISNGNFDKGQSTRIYRNDGVGLIETVVGEIFEPEDHQTLAWGDLDGDGDLDLAVGNGGRSVQAVNQLFRNDGGELKLDSTAWPTTADRTMSIAWGDVDSDGDLDLAVGNFNQVNHLYINHNGTLIADDNWKPQVGNTTAVIWGDVEGDGDLDLAVGGKGDPIRIYLNDGITLASTPAWESSTTDQIWDIAWGDFDKDGDLDLATGSKDGTEPVRVYVNYIPPNADSVPFLLVPEWASIETYDAQTLAWADVDDDGYLELSVGYDGQKIYIYDNIQGELQLIPIWQSAEVDETQEIAWGDYDGDGDLDLAVANMQRNRLYHNEAGVLGINGKATWQSGLIRDSKTIAWGDVDLDGDLDLAVGNFSNTIRIYTNPRRVPVSKQNDPPFVYLGRPGTTDLADFYATSEVLTGSIVDIPFTLYDAEEDVVPHIFPEYSLDGGTNWHPATAAENTITTQLSTAPWPNGRDHLFRWQADADIIKNDHVLFRIRVYPNQQLSPILWGAQGTNSLLFRVEAPWYIRVVDEQGRPVSNIPVYADGEVISETANGTLETNVAGLLNPGALVDGTSLVALAPQETMMTKRDCHNGGAYKTYITNFDWDIESKTIHESAHGEGEQLLVVKRQNALILFNLILSIEWEATTAYLSEIETAMKNASDYLYDVTDGQMAFGEVEIYHNKVNWSCADIQIAAHNRLQPYAYIGKILSDDPSYVIRLGRAWDRYFGDAPWDESDGYRTIVHEFAHYALHLYDEYEGYIYNDAGRVTGVQTAYCVNINNRKPDDEGINASIMDWHYTSSEFAMRDVDELWDEDQCPWTYQFQLNEESDWETIVRYYKDTQEDNPRWHIRTPADRGFILAGPYAVPEIMPQIPQTFNPANGTTAPTWELTVKTPNQQPLLGAFVTLYRQKDEDDEVPPPINQGVTDENGKIEIYGATHGDKVTVITIDGRLYGEEWISNDEIEFEIMTTRVN